MYACCCSLCAGTGQTTIDMQSADVLDASLVRIISPAAPANTIIIRPISGDSRIDGLLLDVNVRLNNTVAPGTPVMVTYSFPAQQPFAYSGSNAVGWNPFTREQQSATREVLNSLQTQIGITFVEVASTPFASGTIRFSNNAQPASAGYAYLANSSRTSLDSDVFISNNYRSNVTPGSYAWTTLVHELGHALGLKHPGNYNAVGSGSTSRADNLLGVNEDTYYNSIMTYRDSAQGIQSTSFMPYDMLALRYLYGTRTFEIGNNTYTFSDATGQSVRNIVDDGGTDTLDFSAVTAGVTVNLTPGGYSSVGKLLSGVGALANLTLSLDAVIENVIGTAQADVVYGNAANNTLTGGRGNDILDGAGGVDAAVFSGLRAGYVITKTQFGQTVRDNAGTHGTDTLVSIERLFFSDSKLALDLDGHAGQTVKLIGAVFGKAALLSTGYVAEGLRLLDGGMSYEDLGTAAINVTGNTKSTDVVTLLWINLFGIAPSANQSAPYVAMLDNGMSAGALAVMAAETPENLINIDLVGLTQTGVMYV